MSESISKKKEILNYIEYYTKSEDAQKIIESSKITNEEGFDLWSFKKLILLEYYIKPYLSILLNRDYKCFFIDFFSSCGANKIEGEEIISIGSPIISILKGIIPNKSKNRNNRFHKWFFIDNQEKYCKALESRVIKTLEIINEKYKERLEINKDIKILCGDCNKKVDEVIEELEKEAEKNKIAVLAFIDPYTFSNIEWKTWEKLLKLKYVDIIFTFPTNTIKRGIPVCKNGEKYLPPSLIKFCDNINSIQEDKFIELYAKDIANLVNRTIWHYKEGIKVKTTKNSEIYRIFLFTHSGPAIKLTMDIVKRLDNIAASDIKFIIEQIYGKLKSLKDYY